MCINIRWMIYNFVVLLEKMGWSLNMNQHYDIKATKVNAVLIAPTKVQIFKSWKVIFPLYPALVRSHLESSWTLESKTYEKT